MSLYTIDEFFDGVKEQCSVREFVPMLLLAVSFPHGPDRPRFHAVFPEKIALDDAITTIEQVLAQLKDRRIHIN